jgi:hypothetical protein
MNTNALSEYLHFDAERYYRERIEVSTESAEIMKQRGQWDEISERVHHYSHIKAETDLKQFEDASPEMKRTVSLWFLEYVSIIKPISQEQLDALSKLPIDQGEKKGIPNSGHVKSNGELYVGDSDE